VKVTEYVPVPEEISLPLKILSSISSVTDKADTTGVEAKSLEVIITLNLIIDNDKEVRFREATANGTNYVSLSAPSTLASDLTLTLPSADGTSGQVLQTNGSGVLSFAGVSASAGQVIQVVTATDLTQRSTTSQSFVTGSNTLSASITPSSASNKILVLVSTNAYGSTANCFVTVYRGGTNLGNGNSGMMAGGTDVTWNASFMIYDSPATTSATTYQVYFRHSSSSGISFINSDPVKSSITLLEVKG